MFITLGPSLRGARATSFRGLASFERALFFSLSGASDVPCACDTIGFVIGSGSGLRAGDAGAVTELRTDFGCGLLVIVGAAVSNEDVVGAERDVDCGLGVSRKAAPATGFIVCSASGLRAGDAGAVTELRSGFDCGLLVIVAAADSNEDVVGAERAVDCSLDVSRKAALATSL